MTTGVGGGGGGGAGMGATDRRSLFLLGLGTGVAVGTAGTLVGVSAYLHYHYHRNRQNNRAVASPSSFSSLFSSFLPASLWNKPASEKKRSAGSSASSTSIPPSLARDWDSPSPVSLCSSSFRSASSASSSLVSSSLLSPDSYVTAKTRRDSAGSDGVSTAATPPPANLSRAYYPYPSASPDSSLSTPPSPNSPHQPRPPNPPRVPASTSFFTQATPTTASSTISASLFSSSSRSGKPEVSVTVSAPSTASSTAEQEADLTSSRSQSPAVSEPNTLRSSSPGEGVEGKKSEEEGCPGIGSENAGKASACEGCPNRGFCTSGGGVATLDSKQVQDAVMEKVGRCLAGVKKKILILSGKGGVGKSTVASQLAWTAALRGLRVGICDVDVCGPSIPLMMRALHGEVHQSAEGWQPVYVRDNLAVMSIGFLLPDSDAAVIWRGPKKNGLIRQFLAEVLWGELDLLLIDTPPGTSDEHLSVVSLLTTDGAVVVTTPQEASLQDVRKELNFCKKAGVKVLGVVENMAGSIFSGANADGPKRMCEQMEVPYAGSIPLDPSLLRACEEGYAVVEENPADPASEALERLVTDLLTKLGLPQTRDEEEEEEEEGYVGSCLPKSPGEDSGGCSS